MRQATVQAALALSPMDAVMAAYHKGDPNYTQYREYAQEAQVTAIFCIVLCSAIGTLLIRFFAPLLLVQVQTLL